MQKDKKYVGFADVDDLQEVLPNPMVKHWMRQGGHRDPFRAIDKSGIWMFFTIGSILLCVTAPLLAIGFWDYFPGGMVSKGFVVAGVVVWVLGFLCVISAAALKTITYLFTAWPFIQDLNILADCFAPLLHPSEKMTALLRRLSKEEWSYGPTAKLQELGVEASQSGKIEKLARYFSALRRLDAVQGGGYERFLPVKKNV